MSIDHTMTTGEAVAATVCVKVVQLRRTQWQVLRALSEAGGRVNTRDLAARCGLVLNEVRWACNRLIGQGLVRETKQLMSQDFGDKKAHRPVSFFSMTPAGRDVAGITTSVTGTTASGG